MKTLIIFALSSLLIGFGAHGQGLCAQVFNVSSAKFDSIPRLNLKQQFVGEENGVFIETSSGMFGRGQRAQRIFMKTRYLTTEELKMTAATVGPSGKLISRFENSLDFIFIVNTTGEMHVYPLSSNQSGFTRLKHSSLAQGQPVLMAGEISLNRDGTIFSVSNKSGHYQPSSSHLNMFLKSYFSPEILARIKVVDESRRF
ncbi:hypothetical protein [Bdellovibrio sp. ArHS]|uniref:hypothetical protein n=1 Tax=Bdellovibrio sp. ArHS TaxID=1569284 RepID=UPI0025C3F258|nr:hypothetical protein [Bdellovibrio sp. ArHS]